MIVNVRLFGQLAAAANAANLNLETPAAPTCSTLRARIAQAEPRLAALLPSCRFAVNHEFADEAQVIDSEDEVALIGFVSGG